MPKNKEITVRRVRLAHLRGPRWEVDCGMVAGKRLRRFFRSREDAGEFAAGQREKLRAHGERALALTEEDRVMFQAARDRLAAAGATIARAVEYFLANHRSAKKAADLRTLIGEAALAKELGGARPRYVSQFACSCRSFARGRETMPADGVTKDDVRRWILGAGFAPKTQRVYLGDVRSLFAWALEEGYVTKNPVAGKDGFIKLSPPDDGEISALGVGQCRALLKAALAGEYEAWDPSARRMRMFNYRDLIGYVALALFAGVRPEEIRRTPPERIDVRGRTVIVAARSAKTRRRRVIELERVAVAWLRLWRLWCPAAPAVPRNFAKKWRALRAAAGLAKWPHDVLRHTFATYHYAAHGNIARLQSQLGHGGAEETLFRHYRAVLTVTGETVSRRAAEEFWGLFPSAVRGRQAGIPAVRGLSASGNRTDAVESAG